MSDHSHPENASIREVQAVKDELLNALAAVQARLIDHIDRKFEQHEHEHAELTRRANERHARIDAILHDDEIAGARDVGRSAAAYDVLRFLRAINEFRWLIAMIVAAIAWMSGSVQVDVK